MKFDKRFILRDAGLVLRAADYVRCILPGAPLTAVTIHPYVRRRSDEQNNLWWKWMELLAQWSGHTKDEMHELLVAEFLGTYEIEVHGIRKEVRCSSSAASVADFSVMMHQVQAWAAGAGVVLPSADDLIEGRAA